MKILTCSLDYYNEFKPRKRKNQKIIKSWNQLNAMFYNIFENIDLIKQNNRRERGLKRGTNNCNL